MAAIELKLRPFTVPNFVSIEVPAKSRQQGFVESPKFHISELSDEILNELCDQFRTAVFEKKAKGAHPDDE